MPAAIDPPLKPQSLLKLVIAVAVVLAAAFVGQIATMSGLVEWYPKLNKPWFTPPNRIFPLVWSALYGMMALAFWRVLRAPAAAPGKPAAIVVFIVQMILNAAWSVTFFGMRNPELALAVIAALIVAVAWTWRVFRPIDGLAGAMMLPYLAWISFASLLNAAVAWLN
jgi:tryptophan-rich sensory protein